MQPPANHLGLDSEIGALPVSPVLLRVDDENDVVNDENDVERLMDKSEKSARASSRTPAKSAPSSVRGALTSRSLNTYPTCPR